MTDHDGSRWYFPTFEGLIDAKHQSQMGSAVWLYLYCIKYAFIARKEGKLLYNHPEAANEIGVSPMTVKRWFVSLQEHGYIETTARKPYHLEVQVTNWRTIEEWHDTRQPDQIPPPMGDNKSGDKSNTERSNKDDTSYILSISLSGYIYPNGSHSDAAQISLADAFNGLLRELENTKNRSAVLRQIYQLCFGAGDLPDYGYLGKVANKVGGAKRLAQIMWELTTRPPADPLSYIIAVYGDKENAPNNTRSPSHTKSSTNRPDTLTDEQRRIAQSL